jgi:hypothetical protein
LWLVAGGWWLAGWWLVVGGWWLVVGGWWVLAVAGGVAFWLVALTTPPLELFSAKAAPRLVDSSALPLHALTT